MLNVGVLGFDCPACRKAMRLIDETARELGVAVRLEKVSDPAVIAAHRVLSVPGVLVEGKLVHSGGSPSRKQIENWLKQTERNPS
jgi:predicted thioredoxin/glutaredoxin